MKICKKRMIMTISIILVLWEGIEILCQIIML
jgi:hypothetical protein